MKLKSILFIPLLVLILAGCASLGIESPKTFNERAIFAHSQVNGVISATTNSIDARAISSDDAAYARKLAVDTRTFLSAAETAYGAGDISTAEGRLSLAEGILKQLQGYLSRKGVKP